MKVEIDRTKLEIHKRSRGLTNEEIADLSEGRLSVYTLKYLSRERNKNLDERKAEELAEILDCDLNDLVTPDFKMEAELPGWVASLARELYVEEKQDIDPHYGAVFETYRRNVGFCNALRQGVAIFSILTDPTAQNRLAELVPRALKYITTSLRPNDEAFSSWIAMNPRDHQWILNKMASTGEVYVPQQAVLLFIYVLALFETIFLEELALSAAKVSPYRKRDKVSQYYYIANDLERLKDFYLDLVLNRSSVFDVPMFAEYEHDNLYFDDTLLLAAACRECKRHLDGYRAASQYLNRKVVNSIKERLFATTRTGGLELPPNRPFAYDLSRFGQRFLGYRRGREATELAGSLSLSPTQPSPPIVTLPAAQSYQQFSPQMGS